MKTWLNSDQLKEMTGKSLVTAQRIIKTHAQAYPLCVRKVIPEGKKSRPFYEVLWDTDTNQPATSADQSTTGEIYAGSTANALTGSIKTNGRAVQETARPTVAQTKGFATNGRQDIEKADCPDTGAAKPYSGLSTQSATGEDHAGIHNYTRGNAGVGAGKTPKKSALVEDKLDRAKDVAPEPENNNKSNQIFGNANQPIVSQQLGESYGYADTNTATPVIPERSQQSTAVIGTLGFADSSAFQSGRAADLDHATASALVESSALPRAESVIAAESVLLGERQAGNGGEVSQGAVAEVSHANVVTFDSVQRGSSQGLDSDTAGELVVANGIDPEGNWDELSKDAKPVHTFEELLAFHLNGRKPAVKRTMRCIYTKQYKETGVIPKVLFSNGEDGRKGRVGKKSTLSDEIKNHFEIMLRERSDRSNPADFATKRHRKITVLHELLEIELNQKIAFHKITHWLKSRPDLKELIKMKDAERITDKTPSAFPKIPVGELIAMDGVEADYFKLMGGELAKKPLKPIWIHLVDVGSRMDLAMYAYASESNENSADVFNRFIRSGNFARQRMHIRPDQAKGFLNLKPVLHALNQHCMATQGGFMFIDDYARPHSPKDKPHLESSHRLLHGFEAQIIHYFKKLGRVVGTEPGTRRVGNKVEDITITLIDATLEELNASGLTERYLHKHNVTHKHRFTEDGLQKSWVPEQRWNDHVNSYAEANDGDVLFFGDAESRIVKIHGCRKHDATISKEGTITFQKRRYSVAAELIGIGVWSRSATTHIKVGLLSDDALALFSLQSGQFIGEAAVVVSMEAPKHVTDSIKAKVMKADSDTRRIEIVEVLRKQGFTVSMGENGNYQFIVQLINLGLTVELTKELLTSNKDKYEKRNPNFRLNIFKLDAENLLKTPEKIIQYAGEIA